MKWRRAKDRLLRTTTDTSEIATLKTAKEEPMAIEIGEDAASFFVP